MDARLSKPEKSVKVIEKGGVQHPKRKPAGSGIRQTVVFAPETDALVRTVAYWERSTRSEVVAVAVRFYVAHLEAERGRPYKPVAQARMGRPIRCSGLSKRG